MANMQPKWLISQGASFTWTRIIAAVGRSAITSTVPDSFPCRPRAERTALLMKSSLLCEPLPALFFWESGKQTKQNSFFFSSISLVALRAATRADQSTAARFCLPSPPTEGWRPSSWRGPCLPCGSPRSPSCSFPRAYAAVPSWPSTSRSPPKTPARRHLNEWTNEWHVNREEGM